jgi:hypothetical protein
MLDRLRGKPFWYWNNGRHNEVTRSSKYDCCFNHIVGLPTKDGIEKPMFDYERDIYFGLQKPYYLNSYSSTDRFHIKSNNILFPFKAKHLWIKKATGLGATEFMLRFMAWLCVHNDDYQNSQMVIVTGPNIDLAIKLIRRMKKLFQDKLDVSFDSKETVFELNGCEISAYPSNHIDSFRSLTNPRFILVDEGDYLPKFQQEEVRAVSERYIAKSDPFIVMVSTPNAPGGLFQQIEQEPFETCLY